MLVISMYDCELNSHGRCSVRKLAELASVSKNTAWKATNLVIPTKQSRGHGYKGAGSLTRMTMKHNYFIFTLYLDNSSIPLDGYVEELQIEFAPVVNKFTIQRWFMTIGLFKGTMRITSSFPFRRYSYPTYCLLCQYLKFVVSVDDHRQLVFVDEKPMKERNIFWSVRRNPNTGKSPEYRINANSKNRYNILAAITIKTGVPKAVDWVLLQKYTDAPLFCQFVRILLDNGTLSRGDIFIVDNCSIHVQGDNIGLQT